jgi:hypothetical protein
LLHASGEGFVLHNFCHALADHDAGRMGVAGGNPRHKEAACDAQIADAADPQLGVDKGELVLAHLRGTGHMLHGHRAIADQNEGRRFS